MQTLLMGLLATSTILVQTGSERSAAETELRQAIDEFSEAMSEKGFGWEGHAAFLHEDYTRCYNGGATVDRAKHIAGIRQWWEAGNRVQKSERRIEYLKISGDVAVVRIAIIEHHADPAGEVSEAFDGHVSQVWLRNQEEWELLSNEVIARRE